MIAEAALTIAGDSSVLVGRPAGVAHVYTGPLTPSGRFAAAVGRTVCRARTRRLAVLSGRRSSLDPAARRLCARCSACLMARYLRQAEPQLCTHRTDYAYRYAGLTRRDVWAQVVMAETLAELEHIAHVSLVVLGHQVCQAPLPVSHEGLHAASLTELIGRRREALAGYPNRGRSEALNALIASGYAQAKAERAALHKEREDRIRRLGFTNATR